MITPELFEIVDSDNWKAHLDKEGFVVIKNVLSNEEMEASFQQFKTDWNHVSPNFNFEDKSTWIIDNSPLMFGKGMAVFNGFGQSDFMWGLRTNSNIQSIYEKVYNVDKDELCVSFDGFSLFLTNKQKSQPWIHIDQNPKNDMYSIQGAYNFKPVNKQDAGFIVVPGSHLKYRPKVDHNRDWIQCGKDSIYNKLSKKLIIPENCFTLWNSRLIHANQGMTKKTTELNRVTCYITFLPKKYRTEKTLGQRIEAYKNSKTTSHWANKCELKTYPYGFKSRYESRGFGSISSLLLDNEIPENRMVLF